MSLCKDLSSINACAFCMMRFANVKQERAYQQTKEVSAVQHERVEREAREEARGGNEGRGERECAVTAL